MSAGAATVSGACHCGATRFTIPVPESVTECNCTFCSKRGMLWAYNEAADVVIDANESDGVYARNGINRHHFCLVCGCSTFSETPSWNETTGEPDMARMRVNINARLLEGIELESVPRQFIDGLHGW